jgi:hypothetical protein
VLAAEYPDILLGGPKRDFQSPESFLRRFVNPFQPIWRFQQAPMSWAVTGRAVLMEIQRHYQSRLPGAGHVETGSLLERSGKSAKTWRFFL